VTEEVDLHLRGSLAASGSAPLRPGRSSGAVDEGASPPSSVDELNYYICSFLPARAISFDNYTSVLILLFYETEFFINCHSIVAKTMASGPLKAALLIVSTTAAKDASADASGPILAQVLKDEGDEKWEVQDTKIVSDDVLAIQRQITAWTDGPDSVNLVVTTGGTGFATGDSTPEVSTLYGLL
jgi:hypothetical protein